MKAIFKPLGIAAAVAAVTAGYTGSVNAQPSRAVGDLSNMAIIPYYTVQSDWVTGVHIINTSYRTTVVKLRLRRASDSADALDFNLVMSPKDEWTGYINDESGNIVFATEDKTCTVPVRADGKFPMPSIFREGAEEGYIEVIGMGHPAEPEVFTTPPTQGFAGANGYSQIAYYAKHVNGVPRDCDAVASNFFANGVADTAKGVIDNETTEAVHTSTGPTDATGPFITNTYEPVENVLKVSYFVRDAASGVEFGGSAVHIADFDDGPGGEAWMSNQEFGLFSGDIRGFDYPDLNGGPLNQTPRGLYNMLRSPAVLGVTNVLNDWSIAASRNVSTDWVVTMPGQYAMLDYGVWQDVNFKPADCGKLDNPTTAVDDGIPQCDFRDIPVLASLTLYDREEGVIVPEQGDLVISPAPPTEVNALLFPYEVNVVEWTDGSTPPVLNSDYNTSVDASVLGDYGWASLSVSATRKTATQNGSASPDANSNGQAVCDWVQRPSKGGPGAVQSHEQRDNTCVPATGNVPIVGFVAWERSFPGNPDANYGRLVDHSFVTSSAP
ncbi:MAG: hypothetical protein KDI16_11625 [Halioglobus sp.]|nr:hypothetical protein [Halioglobus sp.]